MMVHIQTDILDPLPLGKGPANPQAVCAGPRKILIQERHHVHVMILACSLRLRTKTDLQVLRQPELFADPQSRASTARLSD